MLNRRVIPSLLLHDGGLIKTTQFKNPKYIGDPINAIRIFNDKEVDELILLDVSASVEGRGPSFGTVREIASECFMPVAYGGGIRNVDEMRALLRAGIEKVIVNTAAIRDLALVRKASAEFGSQAVVVSIDVRRKLLGRYEVVADRATRSTGMDPVAYAKRVEEAGAGEIYLAAVDRDGTQTGYDVELISRVAKAVSVPVIASGGARDAADMRAAITAGGASAVAAGAMFVFHGKHKAVLISYPDADTLRTIGT